MQVCGFGQEIGIILEGFLFGVCELVAIRRRFIADDLKRDFILDIAFAFFFERGFCEHAPSSPFTKSDLNYFAFSFHLLEGIGECLGNCVKRIVIVTLGVEASTDRYRLLFGAQNLNRWLGITGIPLRCPL